MEILDPPPPTGGGTPWLLALDQEPRGRARVVEHGGILTKILKRGSWRPLVGPPHPSNPPATAEPESDSGIGPAAS